MGKYTNNILGSQISLHIFLRNLKNFSSYHIVIFKYVYIRQLLAQSDRLL